MAAVNGTAYIKSGYVIAFHYGYSKPDNAPEGCIVERANISCAQTCFYGLGSYESDKFRIFEKKGKQFIERVVYPRFRGVITMGLLSDIEDIEILDNCTDASVLARAMRSAGEFLIKRSQIR
jgi:hypothetical protein